MAGASSYLIGGTTIGIKTTLLGERRRRGRGPPDSGFRGSERVCFDGYFIGGGAGEYIRFAYTLPSTHEISCGCGACALGLTGLLSVAEQLPDTGQCYYLCLVPDGC